MPVPQADPAHRRHSDIEPGDPPVTLADGTECDIDNGHVVIAAITSCSNTSNPAVMIAAAFPARNAVERGLDDQTVGEDLAPRRALGWSWTTGQRSGLLPPSLEALGFHLVGFGCTTCIGNSGPVDPARSPTTADRGLGVVAASVLSGNRNFEGRINPDVRMNYLASPPLVRGLHVGRHHGH